MFTNWLTGTGSTSASSYAASNRTQETDTPNGLLPHVNGANGLTNINTNIISTPPDVILEVGPGPQTVRFMAHSIILGMHSGYLRSAIRLDERINGADFVVYLTNVTTEQFAPLLSYMYTGFLELNVENIFGVLLATHVLHMPRALEICRSFLARGQAEGFFGTHNNPILQNSFNNSTVNNTQTGPINNSKIIRPIPSKPQLTNFGFLPMTHSMALPPLADNRPTILAPMNPGKKSPDFDAKSNKDDDDDIEVEDIEKKSVNSEKNHVAVDDDDDEDVEVFIDTYSEAELAVETEIRKLSFKKSFETNQKISKDSALNHTKAKQEKSHKKPSQRHDKQRRRGNNTTVTSSSGLQVAKAPIPASQLDTSEANKVIIDVASCDGPVRFKRILNTAYGHKPETCSSANPSVSGAAVQERSLQSVSLSFHQQMAKNISQQQLLRNGEESENSETSNGSAGGGASTIGKSGRKVQNEVFVCVYCKHTFKSQYCYQKHAKRHLNPLTLQATCVPSSSAEKRHEDKKITTLTEHPATSKSKNIQNARPFFIRSSSSQLQTNQAANSGLLNTSTEFLRREVRPLDMNVQYYPCKTCGCKFPSYYFVHKHRKMCHADEENQQAQQNAATTTTSAVLSPDNAAATDDAPDEATNNNSKNGD